MPFFYWLHTDRYHRREHINNNCYAVIPATPTPLKSKIKKSCDAVKKIKQAIGGTDHCKKRAVSSVFFQGTLTVEAALVLPLFLGAVLLLSGLFQAIVIYEQVNSHLCMTGRQLAAYSEAFDGCSMSDVWRLFYRELADSSVEIENIVGGYAGIKLEVAEESSSGLIKLEAGYRIKIPGYFVGSRSIAVQDRIYMRPWTGGRLPDGTEGERDGDSSIVFVAENGVVYHTSETCTYLQLSIHQCSLDQVDALRNVYGARYIPCERCGYAVDGSTVFITDTGRAWHSDRQCSGLKRDLHTLTLEEAVEHGMRPCFRCGGH